MRPDMALLWSVKGEGPLEAPGTIIVLEGWCLRHLTFIQGRPTTHPRAHKLVSLLNEILRLPNVGPLANKTLFKTWSHVHQKADEVKFSTWVEAFQGVGHGCSRKASISIRYEAPRWERL